MKNVASVICAYNKRCSAYSLMSVGVDGISINKIQIYSKQVMFTGRLSEDAEFTVFTALSAFTVLNRE